MNKQQVIAPLVAMILVVLLAGIPYALITGHKNRRFYVHARSEEIAHNLIKSNNSVYLTKIGANLQTELAEFLNSTGRVETVKLGDLPPPDGDGTACSQAWLINEKGEQLVVRLRQEEFERFSIISFYFPSVATNRNNFMK